MLAKNRWWLLILILIALVIAGLLTLTKYLIAPTVIENSLISKIKENWPGEVRLRGLRFYYLGRISFDELICFDENQRKSVSIKDLNAFLPDLLLFQPKVKKIHIASTEFDLFEPIQITLGKKPLLSDIFDLFGQGYFDLKKLEIENLSLTLHGKEKNQIAFENYFLDLIRHESKYQIELKNDLKEESQSFSLEGVYNTETGNSEFEISMDQSVQPEQAAIIAHLLGTELPYSVKGSFRYKFKLSQAPQKNDFLSLDGIVEFEDWQLVSDQNDLVRNLQTKLIVEDDLLTFEKITGEFCRGAIEGTLEIQDWKNINKCLWKGKLSAKDIDLSVLSESVTLPRNIKHGKLSFDYIFTGKGDDFLESIGDGSVIFQGSDLSKLAVINQIESKEGIKPSKAPKKMDAKLEFRKESSVIIIKKGRITNPVFAVKIEPGAKVDLNNQTYDMHVVFVPLAQIEEVFKLIPLTEILVKLKDQLTRLRIKGSFNKPKDNVIKKEQLEEIEDDTFQFVRDVLNGPDKDNSSLPDEKAPDR